MYRYTITFFQQKIKKKSASIHSKTLRIRILIPILAQIPLPIPFSLFSPKTSGNPHSRTAASATRA